MLRTKSSAPRNPIAVGVGEMTLCVVPMFQDEAYAYVLSFHRHNKPPKRVIFCIGASDGAQLVGVAMVGRTKARALDDGGTLEAVRVCVSPEAPKGTCSFLYSKAWKAARALGWSKLITYTLQSEGGESLRGAGWRIVGTLKPRDPGGWQNRPGREWQEVVGQAKFRWEAA
jgi:hypothetical protein